MTIKIREIKIGNNQISVMLDIHSEYGRKQERIGIRYADVPRTAIEREDKKSKKELVKRIVAQRELEGIHENYSIDKGYQLKADFFEYAEDFIKRKAPVCETRTYDAVINKFKAFLKKEKMPCGAIDETTMIQFKDYLEGQLNGVTAYNYFKKLKRIINEATIAKHFRKNPTENILNNKGISKEKDALNIQQILLLAQTPCSNNLVKRAFLFSCYTGLRFCDVKQLKWEHIRDGFIELIQKKTEKPVTVQLHQSALTLLGDRKMPNDLIFRLPTHTGCLKILKSWKQAANIEKHVTWHVGRVSFATVLLTEGVDPFTVSKLIGHTNITQTLTYLRLVESKRQNAIGKLPELGVLKCENKTY